MTDITVDTTQVVLAGDRAGSLGNWLGGRFPPSTPCGSRDFTLWMGTSSESEICGDRFSIFKKKKIFIMIFIITSSVRYFVV